MEETAKQIIERTNAQGYMNFKDVTKLLELTKKERECGQE
tara:strand:- start:8455 stop:8574 length:120 start_codon:yes stop_codon:yes gene_type:complete